MVNLSNYSFRKHPIYSIIPKQSTEIEVGSQIGTWISHDGAQRNEIPELLQRCMDGEINILFGRFMNPELQSNLIKQLSRLLTKEYGLLAFFTSGSSGQRKLVIHRIGTLFKSAESLVSSYPEIVGRVTYGAFPTSYMAGILNNLIVPLVAKSPIIFDDAFDFSTPFRISKIFNEFRVEWAWMSPTMLKALGKINESSISSSELKLLLNATGPIDSTFRSELASFIGVPILNTYGLTEVLFVSGERKMQPEVSIGLDFPGVKTSLSDTKRIQIETETLPVSIYAVDTSGNVSEILSIDERRFQTNDIAIESAGFIRLVGRIDDIVVLRGLNVSLSEVELAAQSCKGVVDSCARQVETPFGKDIELLIELDEGSLSTNQDIRKEMLRTLPPDSMPGTISFTKLPRLESGKVDRIRIRTLP